MSDQFSITPVNLEGLPARIVLFIHYGKMVMTNLPSFQKLAFIVIALIYSNKASILQLDSLQCLIMSFRLSKYCALKQ